jgi:hypothetical protein
VVRDHAGRQVGKDRRRDRPPRPVDRLSHDDGAVLRQLFADIAAAWPIASAACASMIGTETRIWLPATADVCRVVATEAVTSACEAGRRQYGVGCSLGPGQSPARALKEAVKLTHGKPRGLKNPASTPCRFEWAQ